MTSFRPRGHSVIERRLCDRVQTHPPPYRFLRHSIRALTYATAFATWYEAQLDVLHVVPAFEDSSVPEHSGRTSDPRSPVSRDAIVSEIRRSIESVTATRLNAKVLAQEGRAHELIVHQARAHPADLIVMGTHGRSEFNRLLLGSVTEKVLRTATCPVLTVPAATPAMTAAAVTFKRIICAIDHSPSVRSSPFTPEREPVAGQ